MPYAPRTCRICTKTFSPPHRPTILSTGDNHLTLCPSCRRVVKAANSGEPSTSDAPVLHSGAAPLRQVVFDLETWGLDRGWGVTMVGCFLVHGDLDGPKRYTITLREYDAWKKGKRSDDRELVETAFEILGKCHIAYAHNGDYFDIRWLRTVALKYGLAMPRLKLIDPAAVARQKYLVGRNSLEAIDDFISPRDSMDRKTGKLHLSPDVWREALLDDDDGAWSGLVERCQSDVDILNRVAGAVTGDVGLIDYKGSWK